MTKAGSPSEAIPDYVVCPACHAPLRPSEGSVTCTSCFARYPRHATIHFATAIDDPEKLRQQAIYEGRGPDTPLELPYSDVEMYRKFCEMITDLVHRRGISGYQFKAFKTREVLDQLGPRPGERVLDIGSGDGRMLALLTLHYGVQGTGVDIAPLVVEKTVQANPWGHEYYQADAEQLPFLDCTFDGVTCMDVLEHLPHPERCIAETARILRPGGWALFYAVSQRDTYTWHWAQRQLTDGQIGMDCWAGHRWENFLQPAQARSWMMQAGFDEVQIIPFHALAALILDERFTFIAGIPRFPWLPKAILKVAELADRPLTSRGFCNGFYLIGQKAMKEGQENEYGDT